jgi:hypothetical protein
MKIKENVSLFPVLVLQRTCEFIKDSSLWRSNFIPSVCDSIIIIGLGFVTLYLRFAFQL